MPNFIIDKIEAFDSIVLFRHVYPDMDALGSQLGLAKWIKDTYPQKQVYCAGDSSPLLKKLNVEMDEVSDEQIQSSLGIVLDTSNQARVDGQAFSQCAYTIRIDHHVQVETFCDYEWIDDKASATCEMLGLLFKELHCPVSSKSAQLIYEGLIADSIRFTISSVRPETFEAARYLFECGVDVIQADQFNFACSYQDYQYETRVRNHAKLNQHFLYAVMDVEDYDSLGMTFTQAKEKVYVLSGVEEVSIWALFTRMEDGIHYSASLRSKTIPIRDVAQIYHGGGHECASGIKNLTDAQVQEIIEILSKRS